MTGDDANVEAEPGSAVRAEASARWTPRRTKLAGLGGVVGGLVGAGSLALGASAAAGAGLDVGPVGGALRTLHPFVYGLFAIAVIAADARYGSGPGYGRRGRGVAALLALSLASYAGAVAVLVAGSLAFGTTLFPVGALAGAAYLATRLLGTFYGVVLWRQASASRLAAGLFVALFPAVFVLGPFAAVGLPAAAIQAPLYLAFVALGYDLWTTGAGESGRGGDDGSEVTG